MPLYEFYCEACRCGFEVRRSFSQGTADVLCPMCRSISVQRVFTPMAAFSSGRDGVAGIGGSTCSGCAVTHCAGCPGAGRK